MKPGVAITVCNIITINISLNIVLSTISGEPFTLPYDKHGDGNSRQAETIADQDKTIIFLQAGKKLKLESVDKRINLVYNIMHYNW